MGDWFNTVAVYALLYEVTNSATAVAGMMVVQFLPIAVVGPMAGVIVDRHDRRKIMIGADLVRGVSILGLLLADTASPSDRVRRGRHIGCRHRLFRAGAIVDDSRCSLDQRDIVTAKRSLLRAGLRCSPSVRRWRPSSTALVGRDAAFLINSFSFFFSAALIARIRMPARQVPESHGGFRELLEGLSYMRSHPAVGSVALVKGGWSIAGGALLLLTVFGERIFPMGGSAAAGIGVLYAARGVGAAGGALLVNRIVGRDPQRLRRAIGPAYFARGQPMRRSRLHQTSGPLPPLSSSAHLWLAVVGGKQRDAAALGSDRYRGRVFAAELFAVTVMQAAISSPLPERWNAARRPAGDGTWIGAARGCRALAGSSSRPRPKSGSAPSDRPEQAEEESSSRAGA